MGKLTIIPVCDDKNVKDKGSFGVYIDGQCRGFFPFGQNVDFDINKDCYVFLEYEGERCGKARVTALEHTTLVASYDDIYGKVMFTKVKREKCSETNNYNTDAIDGADSECREAGKKLTVFGKLSKIGGWVHSWFVVVLALMIVGVVVAFLVLIIGELPVAAFIVLGSGAFGCCLFYLEYLLAGYFYFTARDKGYTDLMYLFFPWAFPIIGHLLVVALPDRGDGKNHEIGK